MNRELEDKTFEVFKRIIPDPVWFIENILMVQNKAGEEVPFKLNSAQQKVVRAFLRQYNKDQTVRLVVVKSRQQGISTICRALTLWYSLTHAGIKAIMIAQTQRDLLEKCMPPLLGFLRRVMLYFPDVVHEQHNASSVKFGIKDFSSIYGHWAQSEGENRGTTYHCVHLTEVDLYKDWDRFWGGLKPTIPKERSIVLIESTSLGHHALWSLYQLGDMEMVFLPWYEQEEYAIEGDAPLRLTPEQEAIRQEHHLSDAQMRWYVAQEKSLGSHIMMQREYPSSLEDSFAVEKDNSWFGVSLIEKACQKRPTDDHNSNIYLGIDPSRSRDYTGMVWRRGRSVLRVLNLPPLNDIYALVDRIVYELNRQPADEIFVDIGCGFGSLCDILDRKNIFTNGINLGSAAENRERYVNRRAELYDRAKQWLRAGGRIPNDSPDEKEFVRQLNEIKFDQSNTRLLLTDKSKYTHSPDLADAFVYTFFHEEDYELGEIQLENRLMNNEPSPHWLALGGYDPYRSSYGRDDDVPDIKFGDFLPQRHGRL